jgi:hypothetical protein
MLGKRGINHNDGRVIVQPERSTGQAANLSRSQASPDGNLVQDCSVHPTHLEAAFAFTRRS